MKKKQENFKISCEWCGNKRRKLIGHHYPIAELESGRKKVDICWRCHDIYHHGVLVDARNCKNEREIYQETCKVLKKTFPLLKEIINPKIIILNPVWKWEKVGKLNLPPCPE